MKILNNIDFNKYVRGKQHFAQANYTTSVYSMPPFIQEGKYGWLPRFLHGGMNLKLIKTVTYRGGENRVEEAGMEAKLL